MALLAVATVIAFAPLVHNGFINFDDTGYVTKNPHVQAGLSLSTLRWSLTSFAEANWHPVTWLSHALDCTLFGLNPAGHHATSLLVHLLSVLLLFDLFDRITRARWRSAFVAAVFAVHPLHVESVAWVAERKDVVSGFFWLLTMRAYVEYSVARARRWLLLALAGFALGLMSKPMLITLPFVLVLIDYWPLGRMALPGTPRASPGRPGRMTWIASVREKWAFFALSIASVAITYVAQRAWGATKAAGPLPLWARGANAVLSYVEYLWKTLDPVRLAVFYPHPGTGIAPWKVAGALLVVAALTVVAWKQRTRMPFLIVGWLWFLGTLVPVLGLVQVGLQAMADRYMYIPIIGVAIMAAWGAPAGLERWRGHRPLLAVAGAALTVLMIAGTRVQVGYWKDSATLFRHAIAVTAGNFVAHNSLGGALGDAGLHAEAVAHLREALRIRPDYIPAHHNLARSLLALGDRRGAIAEYDWILARDPRDPRLHEVLGQLLADEGRTDEAMGHYLEAIRIDAHDPAPRLALAALYADAGRFEEARAQCTQALATAPGNAAAHDLLGRIATRQGRFDEALAELHQAVRLDPADARQEYDLGNAFAARGRMPDAESHWVRAIGLDSTLVEARANLGRLYATQGRTEAAARQFAAILRIDPHDARARDALERLRGPGIR